MVQAHSSQLLYTPLHHERDTLCSLILLPQQLDLEHQFPAWTRYNPIQYHLSHGEGVSNPAMLCDSHIFPCFLSLSLKFAGVMLIRPVVQSTEDLGLRPGVYFTIPQFEESVPLSQRYLFVRLQNYMKKTASVKIFRNLLFKISASQTWKFNKFCNKRKGYQ